MKKENHFVLHNGVQIPEIGFGTWNISNEDVFDAVTAALRNGYRHIDTAFTYQNEENVGKAVRESGIPREEIFVTSKLSDRVKSYEGTKENFATTMESLGLDYLDLYLIHWPWPWDENGADYDKENIQVWKAMEEFYKEGKVRAIGVSNFSIAHIQNLMDHCEIVPMVNQIPFYIGRDQQDLIDFCHKNNIVVEAYSPLATGEILNMPEIKAMAQKYQATVAQICIKYCLQKGTLPLPKSTHESRIAENKQLGFIISDEDMATLDQIEDIRND